MNFQRDLNDKLFPRQGLTPTATRDTPLLPLSNSQTMEDVIQQETKANGVQVNNCSLILITKQEKANDANAFSTVIVLEESGGFKNVLKLYVCTCCMW